MFENLTGLLFASLTDPDAGDGAVDEEEYMSALFTTQNATTYASEQAMAARMSGELAERMSDNP